MSEVPLYRFGMEAAELWEALEKLEQQREREFFIVNLLVRIHYIIEIIWWTGLAPWLNSLFQVALHLPP